MFSRGLPQILVFKRGYCKSIYKKCYIYKLRGQIDLNKECVVIYVNMKKLVVIYIKKCFEFKTFFLIVMDRGLY